MVTEGHLPGNARRGDLPKVPARLHRPSAVTCDFQLRNLGRRERSRRQHDGAKPPRWKLPTCRIACSSQALSTQTFRYVPRVSACRQLDKFCRTLQSKLKEVPLSMLDVRCLGARSLACIDNQQLVPSRQFLSLDERQRNHKWERMKNLEPPPLASLIDREILF